SYTGGTTISGGTLVATNVEALGSGEVSENAVLVLNTGGVFTNALSGSGQVGKSGDRTLTHSGAESYSGGSPISGGTLGATHVEALGTGNVTDNATLELNTAGEFVNNILWSCLLYYCVELSLKILCDSSYTGCTTISVGT
ncbi:autotransporter-associated beta strand repeat-containing protein, partial [Salmonella enterica subsp. enterica serovar Kentucky]|uniref:autotransporter-associated beta strand repeat-containing protein n=1 Tax=Salmonella enterica TaxID=28901 RepID=UPI003F4B14BF